MSKPIWLSTPKEQDRLSLLFLILGIPLFFPQIFLGKAPGPFAAGVGDSYTFFEPYARIFFQAISNGTNPFWSHESSFGAPTLLTLGTGALHPFHIFHLFMSDWLAFVIGWWARIAIFSAFFYAYLRNRLVRPWVAISFTLSLSFGSFFVNYSLEIIGYVMAFFPMVLYYTDKLCEESKATDFVFLVLAIASMILGGFPSVILYLLLTLGAYLLVMSKNWRQFVIIFSACFTGILIVLPAIVETLSFYPSTGYDPEQRKLLFFYDPPSITALNLLIPSVFGNIHEYSMAGMRDYFGSLLGAGILTLPLATIFGLYSIIVKKYLNREITFWLVVLIFCLVAYFNIFEVKQLLKYVPILNEHPFTRLQTLITLASVSCSALLLEHLLRLRINPRHWYTLLGLLVLTLFCTYGYTVITVKAEQTLINCIVYGAIAALSVITLALAILRPSKHSSLAFIGCNIILGIATSVSYTYYFSPKDYYPENELITYVKEHLVPGARILDVKNALYKNTAIAYSVPSITNHWFVQPSLRNLVYQVSTHAPSQGLTHDVINSIDDKKAWPVLRQMHVQFVSLPYTENQKWIDSHNNNSDWKVISQNIKGISLLEVLYNDKPIENKLGISGKGYSEYIEQAGRISFKPTEEEEITIPVRFHDGWHISKGATAIKTSSDALITILPKSNIERVELEYFPRHFYFLLIIGPIILLLFFLSLKYSENNRQYNK